MGYKETIQIYVQFLLYLCAFMANGVFDSISAVYMMQQCGIAQEANAIARNIVMAYGYGEFVMFKLLVTAMILFVPIMVQLHSKDSVKYTVWAFLLIHAAGGILATMLNLSTVSNSNPPFSPQLVLFVYFTFGIPLLYIGDYFDRGHKNDSYARLLKNVLYDLDKSNPRSR